MAKQRVTLDKSRSIASIVNPVTQQIWGVEYGENEQVNLFDPYGVQDGYKDIPVHLLHSAIELDLYSILFYKDEIPEGGF